MVEDATPPNPIPYFDPFAPIVTPAPTGNPMDTGNNPSINPDINPEDLITDEERARETADNWDNRNGGRNSSPPNLPGGGVWRWNDPNNHSLGGYQDLGDGYQRTWTWQPSEGGPPPRPYTPGQYVQRGGASRIPFGQPGHLTNDQIKGFRFPATTPGNGSGYFHYQDKDGNILTIWRFRDPSGAFQYWRIVDGVAIPMAPGQIPNAPGGNWFDIPANPGSGGGYIPNPNHNPVPNPSLVPRPDVPNASPPAVRKPKPSGFSLNPFRRIT